MNNDLKVCKECSTENEPQYKYCKNCGASLDETSATSGDYYNQTCHSNSGSYSADANRYKQGFNGEFYGDETIEGVTVNEMSAFIGKNFNDYITKFFRMHITGKKTSWLWPPAILAFFFGPIGAALWLFYRKMPKIAIIFLSISIALSVGQAAVTIATIPEDTKLMFEAVVDELLNGKEQFESLEILLTEFEDVAFWSTLFGYFVRSISIVVAIVVGAMGGNWYKNKAINSILEFRNKDIDKRYYLIGLSVVGGTSGGMLALGIILASVIPSLISTFTAAILWL